MFGQLVCITETSKKMLAQQLLVCIIQQILIRKMPQVMSDLDRGFSRGNGSKVDHYQPIGLFFSTDGLDSSDHTAVC